MGEKAELARRINLAPPVDPDSDSDFEEHEDIYTPRTSVNGTIPVDLPPTYEESEAAARTRGQPNPHPHSPPPGIETHAEVTVYRTEIPPDPPIQIIGDDKRPDSPPSTGPRAPLLLNEALRFTETPPPIAERTELPTSVAVPSFAGSPVPVRFARFYAPALYPQSVADTEFIEFIDGLNNLSLASNFSAATYHSRSSLSPYEVSREDESLRRDDLVSAYIALSNSHFFNPRGLQVQLADLAELADLLNISNAAIRKTILQEVLRMAKTGVDVPTAANGAAHQAAEALVPYVEKLTTAVPEPRKNQEALQAVALRFASMDLGEADEASEGDLERRQTSSSGTSGAGPSRSKTWGEWGNDVGKFWGDWGEKQGRFWGQWGEDQGRKWGKLGEEMGRKVSEPMQGREAGRSDLDPNKVEKMSQGPPAWMAGASTSRCSSQPPQPGPWGRGGHPVHPLHVAHTMHAVHAARPWGRGGMGPRGGPAGPWGRGGMGGRAWSVPWTPPGVSLPFQMPSHHGSFEGPEPQTEHETDNVHDVDQPTPPPPPPPAAEEGPHNAKDADDHYEDGEEGFKDIADTLSLSSVSSSSSSDSDKTLAKDYNDNDDAYAEHEAMLARKAERIEKWAAEAYANNSKPPHEIEIERARAQKDLELDLSRHRLRRQHRDQKRRLKRDLNAWKRKLKAEFKTRKSMDKTQRREWKRTVKSEWKAYKTQMKAHGRAYKGERKALKREMKEVTRAAKREGKKKDWEGKRQEWDERMRERSAQMAENRARWGGRGGRGGGRGGRGGRRGSGGRGFAPDGASLESLNDDLETQAREMLWVVVTKFEG